MAYAHVTVGTGTAGSKYLKRKYPIEEGLTAGTQKQEGTKNALEAEISKVRKKDLTGVR